MNGVVVFGLAWTLVPTGVRRGGSSLEPAMLEELLEESLEEELIMAW